MARGKVKDDSECRLSWFGVRMQEERRRRLDQAASLQKVTASDLARQGIDNLVDAILSSSGQTATPAANATEGA